LLHTLITHDPTINVSFEVNRQVAGASWKKYEVDLFCAKLKFAVEVDGTQHLGSPKQKARDCARDADLAKVGITTRRVLASAIMSDPTSALRLVRDEIASRTSEIMK
jgi:very-short-patch-repair endonuclease